MGYTFARLTENCPNGAGVEADDVSPVLASPFQRPSNGTERDSHGTILATGRPCFVIVRFLRS